MSRTSAPRRKRGIPIYPRRKGDGRVVYDVQVRINGKQYSKTCNTEQEALAAYAQLSGGQAPEPERGPDTRITVAQLFEYVMRVQPPPAVSSKLFYRDEFDKHLRDARVPVVDSSGVVSGTHPTPLGEWAAEDVTTPIVREVLAAMREQGTGARTIQVVRMILGRIYNVGMADGRVSRNPVTRSVKVDQPQTRETVPLTGQEVERLALAAGDQWGRCITLMAWTGLRIGEVLGLRVSDWNPGRGELVVERAVKEHKGRMAIEATKTHESRTIPLIPPLRDIVRKQVGDRIGAVPLFPMGTRQAVPSNFRHRVWEPSVRRAKFTRRITPHALRHTAATLMAEAGWPLGMAQAVLGHMSADMTRRYTHVSHSMQQDAMAKLAAHFEAQAR